MDSGLIDIASIMLACIPILSAWACTSGIVRLLVNSQWVLLCGASWLQCLLYTLQSTLRVGSLPFSIVSWFLYWRALHLGLYPHAFVPCVFSLVLLFRIIQYRISQIATYYENEEIRAFLDSSHSILNDASDSFAWLIYTCISSRVILHVFIRQFASLIFSLNIVKFTAWRVSITMK